MTSPALHAESVRRLKQWVDVPGAFLAIGFGVLLIAVPGILLPLLGLRPDANHLLLARLYGAVLINFGGISGWAAKCTQMDFNRLFAGINTLVDLLSCSLLVLAGAHGRLSLLGWGLAGIFGYQGIVNAMVSYRIARSPSTASS